jgi:outer membrane protein assembly factor BamB
LTVVAALFVAGSPATALAAWSTYHLDAVRSGNDTTEPSTAQLPSAWTSAALDGDVYAEPLTYGSSVIVATENDTVYALDASTGATVWSKSLGTPVSNASLPCGNIDPVGITGTPVIDPATGTLYVVANLSQPSISYSLFALDLKNSGNILWQDSLAIPGSPTFDPLIEGQRGALVLAPGAGTVYIPFGGRYGDCNDTTVTPNVPYLGWIVGAPTTGSVSPSSLLSFPLPSPNGGGGIWASGGIAVDSSGNVWASTGNTECTSPCAFDYGNSVLKLSSTLQLLDYFAPTDWSALNASDTDVGSTSPSLLGNNTVFQVGKYGTGYLLNTASLGHVSTAPFEGTACPGLINNDAAFGATAYAAPYLYIPCRTGLVALKVDTAAPSFSVAWTWQQAATSWSGPPIIAGGVVWTIDPAGTLYGVDPYSGVLRFNVAIGGADHFATPTSDNGRLFVAAGSQVEAFTLVPGWHPWESLGGNVIYGPDMDSTGTSLLDTFAIGTDSGLYQRHFDGTTWGGWAPLGGRLTSRPGAVFSGAGRIDVFARGTDNAAWHRAFVNNAWQPWESLGGSLLYGPDAASQSAGTIDLFAVGTDRQLYRRSFANAVWTPWAPLGGRLTSNPGAVSWGAGELDVFGRGTDNALWHLRYNGSWLPWESLGGVLRYGPDVASWGANRLDVFAVGSDSALYHRYFGGAWSNWEGLGGRLTSDAGTVSWGTGRIDVAARGSDNAVWHLFYQQ